MIALPSHIDPEAWAGFVEMRTKLKKPLTTRAAKMILTELQKIKDAGHDANAALDQSTMHCWLDVYAPKDKTIERKSSAAPAQTSAYLEDLAAHSAEATAMPAERRAEVAAMLQKAKARIRRVA
jgi:hypothetical protein